jgi:predicted nucleic acid-binding Zn ribbon protein
MRKSNDQSLKEVIEDLLDTYKLRGKLNEVRLVESWEKIMGKMIANRTTSIYIRNKKLYVKLSSAPLREELSYGKEKIKNMLNESIGVEVITEVILM